MEERQSFYVTLPSNACHDIFPDNNSSNYTITLSCPIELQGAYEVALAEIMYCQTWNNIISLEDNFDALDHTIPTNAPIYLKIATGNYESIEQLVKEINRLFKEVKIEIISINVAYICQFSTKFLKLENPIKEIKRFQTYY